MAQRLALAYLRWHCCNLPARILSALFLRSCNGCAKDYNAVGPADEAQDDVKTTHHAAPRPPLQLNGVLQEYEFFDVTPAIGKEFPEAKLADWLRAPNSDQLIRDLAITGPNPSYHRIAPSADSFPTSLPTRRCLFPRSRRFR